MSDGGVVLFNFCATRENPAMTSVPLGPLYLVSCLERAGIETRFFDYQLAGVNRPQRPESILEFLEQSEAETLAISCWDHLLPSVLLATRSLKKKHPEKKVILGGLGPTAVSDLIVERFPHVDIVVRGPGESVLPKIIDNLNDRPSLMKIPGVCLGGEELRPHMTDTYAPLPAVDSLPWPAYERIDLDQYGRIQLVSSRGCPYRCAFCSIPGLWGHKYSCRSIPSFAEEVEFLHLRKGINRIHIIDDTFSASRERVMDFCERIHASCPELKWTCYSRLDLVDEESCQRMAEAGCDTVYFGVENGSNRVLRRIGKRFDTDMAIEAAEIAGRHFHIIASFIWGLPFETLEDFGQTIILMYHLTELCKSIEVQLFFLAPLAMSDVRREFAGQIRFSPKYLSFFTWGDSSEAYGKEVLELVQRNMDMFPGMCYFDSPDLEEKVRLARDLGLVDGAGESTAEQ